MSGDLQERVTRLLESNRWRLALRELFVGFVFWLLYVLLIRLGIAAFAWLDSVLPGEMVFGKRVMAFMEVSGWFVAAVFFVLYNLLPLLHLVAAWWESGRQRGR